MFDDKNFCSCGRCVYIFKVTTKKTDIQFQKKKQESAGIKTSTFQMSCDGVTNHCRGKKEMYSTETLQIIGE